MEGKGVGEVPFGPWLPVDRHALQARDDKSGGGRLAMTRYCECTLPHGPVIARSDQRERRGNPSCLEIRVRQGGSVLGSQWIATGFALAMTRVGGEARDDKIS